MQEKRKVLVINNNEAIIALFDEYSRINRGEAIALEIVNASPPKVFSETKEAVDVIKTTNFDVLVIGHKLEGVNFERLHLGFEKPKGGIGLEILKLAKDALRNKIIISDGYTPGNDSEVRELYRRLGCRHFINRKGVNFADRFSNLLLCLSNKCSCVNL